MMLLDTSYRSIKRSLFIHSVSLLVILCMLCGSGYYFFKLNSKEFNEVFSNQDVVFDVLLSHEAKLQGLATCIEILNADMKQLKNTMIPATRVTVTCYSSEEEQTDSTPNITAFNYKTGPGQIAISRDLLTYGFTPGSKVYIEEVGVFKITDLMNSRWNKRVDVWVPKGTRPFKYDNKIIALLTETKS